MFDKSKAMNDYQITEQQYNGLLREFVAQASENIENIESTVRTGYSKVAVAAAHSLKGVAGNLRLDACYSIAQGIEAALKAADYDAANSGIAQLRKALDEIRAAIKG